MAVASLVLGIISIVFATMIPGLQMVGTITGVVGIILGALARKVPEKKKWRLVVWFVLLLASSLALFSL